jgi:hypothetical protein
MNKLLAALIAGLFTVGAFAAASAPEAAASGTKVEKKAEAKVEKKADAKVEKKAEAASDATSKPAKKSKKKASAA